VICGMCGSLCRKSCRGHKDLFRRVALVSATILIAAPAFAEIDLSGEWAVKNREECLIL
jgi:hypothetical protein